MPDVAVVLGNGAVGGKHAGFGDVYQTLFAPAHRVTGVIAESLPFAHHVGVEVRQGLEPVFVDQFVMQTGQIFGMTVASISGPVRKLMARRMLASPSTHWAGS